MTEDVAADRKDRLGPAQDIAFDATLVEVNMVAGSAAEVIGRLAARLAVRGYVTAGFQEAVLERERDFPTGLPTAVPVAIPHTEARHCLRSALAVGLLAQPVSFGEMGNSQRTLPVRIVFLLALADPKEQVLWLQRFMRGLRDEFSLHRLTEARTPGQVVEVVRAMLGLGNVPPQPTRAKEEMA